MIDIQIRLFRILFWIFNPHEYLWIKNKEKLNERLS